MKLELSENTFNLIVQMMNSEMDIKLNQAQGFSNAQMELEAQAQAWNALQQREAAEKLVGDQNKDEPEDDEEASEEPEDPTTMQ